MGYQQEHIKDHYDDLNGDLYATMTKEVKDFKFNLVVGGNYRQRQSYGYWYSNQVNSGPVIGQNVIPNGYTKVTNPDGSASATYSYKRYDQSVYADFTAGYDGWLFCMLLSVTTGHPSWIRKTEVSVILPWICRPC